jgi:uncharacterized protein (TIGR02646 family)
MIRVTRITEPEVLAQNKAAWLRDLEAATTAQQRKQAEVRYAHTSVKNALKTMFHGKCAYCESKILHVGFGDIEHFRPKSALAYRDRIFDWDNLLLACSVCNGAGCKGTRFPEADAGGPPVDPCADDPNEHLAFVYDESAQLANVAYKTERGQVTRDLFGLNRPDLRKRRSEFVRKLAALAQFAPEDGEATALLAEAVKDNAEYAAFARGLKAI